MEERRMWPPEKVRRVWRKLRPLLVGLISVAIVWMALSAGFNFVMETFILPVDMDDPTPITIVVENSDSASTIANKLYDAGLEGEEGLINNKAVFKVYVDFVGKATQLRAGTYTLSRNMGIEQIVDIICEGNPPRATTIFTALEGYTIEPYTTVTDRNMLYAIEAAGIEMDEERFLELCDDREQYEAYDFVDQIPMDSRDTLLEGYLFPDTYEVYVDSSPESIINRMLLRFNEIFTEEYMLRAQELGMTIDEVVTLASLIEREAATTDDFAKVSAVFHNRLNGEQNLESCASLQYVHKTSKYEYNAEERAVQSPYNTYMNAGLPIGPICNPGQQAIEAALWPNEEFLEEDYRYFCNMDLPENTSLIFAKTYEEHQENVETYRQYWS